MKKRSWKAELKDLVEMWTGSDNRVLALAWVVCVIGVILMGFYTKSQTASFLGIAESRESIINFEFPVTIKRVHFVPGQAVKKGELLVELDQPDLESKLHIARSQIEKLRAEQSLKREMGRLASQDLGHAEEARGFDPLSSDIKNFEIELRNLESRERNLYVFAEISGVVGSVNFKRGERVAPYATIMTVSPSAPTQVQGFIHESLHSQVKIGQRMEITSLSDTGKTIEGRVISVGSRIVELPLRMARTPVAMWGREVVVEITGTGAAENPFLLGEKVAIHPPSFAMIGFSTAQADAGADKPKHVPAGAAAEPEVIFVPDSVKNRSKFEPSGALYLADLRKFAVVSDDTDDDETPFIFLLNADGSVDGNVLRIDGLDKIRDMESITPGKGDDFYVLSSQSKNENNKANKGRDLIVQVRRRGTALTAVKSFRLRPALVKALKESTVPAVKDVRGELDSDLEIEASFIRDGQLTVAFKNPLDGEGRTLILSLGKIDKIMSSEKIAPADVSIWKILSFTAPGHKKTRITDMIALDADRFVISTTSNGRSRTGHIWIYDPKKEDPVMISEIPSYTPEGLAFDPVEKELMVLFDEGKDDARFMKIKIPGVK